MPRAKHPHKDVEAAISRAEASGWRIVIGGSHAWGRMFCPWNDDGCRCGLHCISCIWSTPRNPEAFARQLDRVVNNCLHRRLPIEDD
ncbi:MAG: hypothetical protein ACOYMX_08960 [Burkholderiales bacterium]